MTTTIMTPNAEDFGLEFDATNHAKWFEIDAVYEAEVGDNRYILCIRQDMDYSGADYINDCDDSIYGKVSKYAYSYRRDRPGRGQRPDGFTGRARKLEVDRGYWMWWEPPATLWVGDREVPWEQAGDEATELTRKVRELLQYGLYIIHVQRQEACNMGHWHTVAQAACGGVDVPYRHLINDLIEEVNYEITDTQPTS
jgi:hypothetical protein